MIPRFFAWLIGNLSDGLLNATIDRLREMDRARLFASIAGHWQETRGREYVGLRARTLLLSVDQVFKAPLLEDVSARVVSCPRGRN